MTVQSLVAMFETMAVSKHVDIVTNDVVHVIPKRTNVHGLVTYYNGLAQGKIHEKAITSGCLIQDEAVRSKEEPQVNENEQQMEKKKDDEEEQMQQQQEQKSSEVPAVTTAPSSLGLDFVSKIPQPKSREIHLTGSSMKKSALKDTCCTRMLSSSSLNDTTPSVFVPPPVPVSIRVRSPTASYAAFVARIKNSQSRLLDFEKKEQWLEQIETMKSRVEALKRRNDTALAKEVASIPRKRRSMSECSGESTASTASMSSMDIPVIIC